MGSEPQPPTDIQGDLDFLQQITVTGGEVGAIIGRQQIYVMPARPADPGELAAAQALLAAMPVGDEDPVPHPGPLAPCSYLQQLTPNPLFTGRDRELRALARALQSGPGAVAVASGIGGAGKTQLAVELAHRYGPSFAGGVFFVSMGDASGAGTAVARCGSRGLVDWRADFEQLVPDEQVALVCSAWQSPLPRLLIFDNCEDEALLQQWRPPTGGCRVLVTSRKADWGAASGVVRQGVGMLDRAEGARLLRSYRLDLDETEAAAVASALGNLPLALHLAGSFLRRYRQVSAAAYLAQLETALLGHPSLLGRGAEASPTGHDLDVARTFALSFDQLRQDDPVDAMARALLSRAACLAPGEPILRELLLVTLESSAADLEAGLQAEDALARLVDLGLLEEEQGALRVHRLVAAYTLHVGAGEEARAAVERTLLRTIERMSATEPSGYLSLQPFDAHLRHLARQPFLLTGEHQARLCYYLGRYFYALAAYDEAIALYTRAAELDPTDTRALFQRARAHGISGRREEAIVDYTAVIERAPDRAYLYQNRALIYQSLGDMKAAAADMERARELTSNPAELLFLETVDLEHRGEYEAAVEGYTRLLTMKPGDTHTLWRRANCHRKLKQTQQALDDYAAVIARDPMAPLSYRQRGRLLIEAGRLDEAVENYRQLTDRHPHDAEAHYQLGRSLVKLARYVEALQSLERTLELDPTLSAARRQLAMAHYRLGRSLVKLARYVEALQSLERALELDPSLNAARWQLGVAFAELGRLEEAIRAYQDYQAHNDDAKWNDRAQRQIDALGAQRARRTEAP